MSPHGDGKTRLESWKEVAAWFDRTDRTVKRWEVERGLPIRRLPGSPKSRIYAEIAELEAWRRGAAAGIAEAAPEGSPALEHPPLPVAVPPPGRGWGVWLAGLATLAAIALILNAPAVTGARSDRPSTSDRRQPPPLEAQRLYLAGMDDWARRTPASLNRAVGEFNAAIARYGDYAEAYAGLAGCYDLMREYTLMPPSQAFPLAKAAAERALALDDRLAGAHASLAFADFYGFWDGAAARREFARAISLEPRGATAHHWFATFLNVQGDGAGALREIDAARALDPSSLAIAADRAWIEYMNGDRARGSADMTAVEAADSGFLSPHIYLAFMDVLEGRNEGYLRETAAAARLTHDPARLAMVRGAASGLRSGGRGQMLEAVLSAQIELFQSGAGSAYAVAQTCALLGDPTRAIAYLQLSVDRREMAAVGLARDPNFASMRADPRFARLARLFRAA